MDRPTIKAIGWAFVAVLSVSGVFLVVGALVINRNVESIRSAWDSFEDLRSEKARMVNSLRSDLGYGGMIHNFKNLVIRGDRSLVDRVRAELGSAQLTIAHYRALGPTAVEEAVLVQIQGVLNAYHKALAALEILLIAGKSTSEIDRIVRVDDRPALRGLSALDEEIGFQAKLVSDKLNKPRVIAKLRWQLGYGGMIHEFKNYVIRHDEFRVKLEKVKLAAAFDALAHYEAFGLRGNETRALIRIRRVLQAYSIALANARRAVAEGKTPQNIDRIVKVNDRPMLDGLAKLNREIAVQVEQKSAVVDGALVLVHSSVAAAGWIVAGLISFLILASIWVIRVRVIGPIGRLTDAMTRLAAGQYVIEVPSIHPNNEVGQMAQTVLVFRENAIERERAEAEIRRLNEDLEARVEQRTAELRAAQETLLRKDRLATLGQLTGTVAHELRNPLGAVANSIAVIQQRCSRMGIDLNTTVSRADRSIKRCDAIITELLDFARAKGLQPKNIDLDDWLRGVIDEFQTADGITINCNLQIGGAVIPFDANLLRRAVINLLDNACQAMSSQSDNGTMAQDGTLSIATRLSGDRAEIEITDTGCGIPEEHFSKILEPLFSTKSFGTGLGLPTVKRIMEDHNGDLEISDRNDRGARAVLWLPLVFGEE